MKTKLFKSIISVSLCLSILFSLVSFFSVSAATQKGVISLSSGSVRVRTSPTAAIDTNKLMVGNTVVNLYDGDEVIVFETVASDGDTVNPTWCRIQFDYGSATLTGYVASQFVEIQTESDNEDNNNDDFVMPEGVPEEYKSYIESLLIKHPNWKFVFYDTGYEWDELFTEDAQGKLGTSAIEYTFPLSYRSTQSGAYNWRTDKWIPVDSNSWFQANTQTIAYYMDPRNFLNEDKVFMFESLSYDATTQNVEGVKTILKNSFMENVKIKDLNGNSLLYADAYIKAAEYSKVSPYHLAARTIQEVGYKGSGSVSGTYSGYEGYYNFYNIGAYAGATPIANGLNFAKTGGSMTDANKKKCLIPWNTQYKAIAGGGYWIGMSYINSVHKQNTLYYQKFNTSNPNNAFYHQYMQNIMAPSSEASSVKKTYSNMGILDNAFTFIIPYYRNMPKEASKLPASNNYNPNNWLKSLTIDGYDIDFDGGKTSGYKLTVPKTVDSVKISATTVNSKAKVTGAGTVNLNGGSNLIDIVVTAENGNKRTYTVEVVKTVENKIPLTGIELSKSTASLFTGDSLVLTVSYKPSNTTDSKAVTWSTSDSKVATVSNGKVTAVGAGTVTITAKVGSFTQTCKVTVTNNETFVKGDVDADGEITIADALMIFKYKSGEVKLSETALKAADTDKNDKVELADALRIFKFKSGEIKEL